jgi:hypothetical protein
VNVRENPTTIYSVYISSGSNKPEAVDRATFRGFMPPSWNLTKTPPPKVLSKEEEGT